MKDVGLNPKKGRSYDFITNNFEISWEEVPFQKAKTKFSNSIAFIQKQKTVSKHKFGAL